MYTHHKNCDQITNMYTVTKKTARCIKKIEPDIIQGVPGGM